ncbi:MAG TPA: glycine zipper 2TM domain-containing protein [Burkholderiales bacterium]|nr:glycine zipper 2TM domain-containing protein [Burkholderiales bacterium]
MGKGMLVLSAATAVLLAGCASQKTGDVYTRDEALREQSVRRATVESVRPVRIEGTRSGVGAVAGGAVGGIAGSTVGSGKTSNVGAVVGALGGGLAGHALEEGVTRRNGIEITVRLDNGETRAIVQDDTDKFVAGQKVRLLSQNGVTRVSP